jgi:hypothetical protein
VFTTLPPYTDWQPSTVDVVLHALSRAGAPHALRTMEGWVELGSSNHSDPGVVKLYRGPRQQPLHWIAPEPLAGIVLQQNGTIAAVEQSGVHHILTLVDEELIPDWPPPFATLMSATVAAGLLDDRIASPALSAVQRGMAALGRWRLATEAPLPQQELHVLCDLVAAWFEAEQQVDLDLIVAAATYALNTQPDGKARIGALLRAQVNLEERSKDSDELLLMSLALDGNESEGRALLKGFSGRYTSIDLDKLEADWPNTVIATMLKDIRQSPGFTYWQGRRRRSQGLSS